MLPIGGLIAGPDQGHRKPGMAVKQAPRPATGRAACAAELCLISPHTDGLTERGPGECVRRAVTRVEPRALVYQVEHCGWACARRERHEDGTWGWWRLDPPGECSGVAWSV